MYKGSHMYMYYDYLCGSQEKVSIDGDAECDIFDV